MLKTQQAALLAFYEVVDRYRCDTAKPLMKGLSGFLNMITPIQSPACTPGAVHHAWEQLPEVAKKQFKEAYATYCMQVGPATPHQRPGITHGGRRSTPKVKRTSDQSWQLSSLCVGLVVYVIGEMLVKAIMLLSPTMLVIFLTMALVCGVTQYWSTIRQLWHPPDPSRAKESKQIPSGGYRLGRAPPAHLVDTKQDHTLRAQVTVSKQDRVVPEL